MGIVEGSCGYPGPRSQYSGKICFIVKYVVQDEGVAKLLNIVLTIGKHSSDPPGRVLLVQGPRGQYSGKIRFIDKRWIQEEGFAMLLNIVLIPGKPSPKSNFRGEA